MSEEAAAPLAFTNDQVVACYSVKGGGLHASLDDALAEADTLNATAGTDDEQRGLAIVTPAMTLRYDAPGSNPVEPAPLPTPVDPAPAEPDEGTAG